MSSRFISVSEACLVLHCTTPYLYQLVHHKIIPYYKPNGGKLLFDAAELEDYVRKGRVATREELEGKAVELLNKRETR